MNLEDKIKESFMKHAEDVRPEAGSWDGVETKVRRSHYARVTMVSTLVVVLIAAAAVVLPRLGSERPKGGFATSSPTATEEPTPTASTTPTGIDTSDWIARVGTQDGFQLLIPPDWKGGWFEGYWDYEPKGLPSLAEGGDTFAVEIHLDSGDYRTLAPKDAKATNIGGRSALAWSPSSGQAAGGEADFAIEWTDCPSGPNCDPGSQRTILVKMLGSTLALSQKYGPLGKTIIQTVRVYDGSTPAHGTVAGIPNDAYRRTLISFLDARVEGIDAEGYMCCNAPAFYSSNGLYGLGPDSLLSYTVHSVSESASAATATYEVTLRYQNAHTRSETISLVYESGNVDANEIPKIGDASSR